jgi:glycosyltransferase involved in cell wall biosynthesis
MKMLARFDRVFAVSDFSRSDLCQFWHWQGTQPRAAVETIALGADFDGAPRGGIAENAVRSSAISKSGIFKPLLMCVGIIEPRKNQSLLLEVAADLWREGLVFELHLIGRVNPHFGVPIVGKIKSLQKKFPELHFHEAADDRKLAELYARARASLFPTLAEGCGLPLLESLWRGVPCMCSNLPVLRENADAGGCLAIKTNDPAEWKTALRAMIDDPGLAQRLRAEAMKRPLPRWADTATALRGALAG